MEDSLVREAPILVGVGFSVLILVVMEDSLVHLGEALVENKEFGLNPCCDGR